MTKFLNTLKNPIVAHYIHLPHLWDEKYFPKGPALSRTSSYRFLISRQNLQKTKDPIPLKRQVRWTGGGNDEKTLFCRNLPVTTVGLVIKLIKIST